MQPRGAIFRSASNYRVLQALVEMMIEEIREEDIEIISELYVETFSSEPWNEAWDKEWAIERLSLIFSCPGAKGLLYLQGKRTIGAILGRLNSFKGKKEFEIVELFVSPDCQRKKIGESLLKEIERRMIQEGVTNFTLLTSKTVGAYEFYKKHGYKVGSNMVFMHHAL